MYKTIIMPVDVFEMELSDKAIRHAEFLAQDDGVIHLLHVLPGSASLSLHRFAADVRRFEEHLQHEAEERLQTMVSHFTIDPSRTLPKRTCCLMREGSMVKWLTIVCKRKYRANESVKRQRETHGRSGGQMSHQLSIT